MTLTPTLTFMLTLTVTLTLNLSLTRYEYEYATRGGWVEIRDGKRMPQPHAKTRQMSSE